MRQSRAWWLRWEERAEAWLPAIARKAVAGTSVLRPYQAHCWSIGRSNAQENQRGGRSLRDSLTAAVNRQGD